MAMNVDRHHLNSLAESLIETSPQSGLENGSRDAWPQFGDAEILAARPGRKEHDPFRPQGFFLEQEYSRAGTVDDVATLLLTNRECPFRCLMCDLWQGTLVE